MLNVIKNRVFLLLSVQLLHLLHFLRDLRINVLEESIHLFLRLILNFNTVRFMHLLLLNNAWNITPASFNLFRATRYIHLICIHVFLNGLRHRNWSTLEYSLDLVGRTRTRLRLLLLLLHDYITFELWLISTCLSLLSAWFIVLAFQIFEAN